jgi:hypothetical protein
LQSPAFIATFTAIPLVNILPVVQALYNLLLNHTMRYTFLLLVLSVTCLQSHSQNQVAVFVGAQATSAKYLVFNQKQDVKLKSGIQAGLNMKVPFEGNLYFAPAAFYSMKGYDVTFKDFAFPPDATAKNNNTTIHSFELAALLQYDFNKNPSHFFLRLGPSLDFQLFGKEKYDLQGGTSVSRNMSWAPGNYGRYSANMNAHLGYEMGNSFFIYGQYTLGAASISNAENGPRIRHRAFGLSIGKYLKRNKVVVDTRNKE